MTPRLPLVRVAAFAGALLLPLLAACKSGDDLQVDEGTLAVEADDGASCTRAEQCKSGVCDVAAGGDGTCASPTATDGVKNGDETDIDCGGASAPACAPGKQCRATSDCGGGICKDQICVSASATDGIKNGDETDIDCGGADPGTPRCATGKVCGAGGDCESLVCDEQQRCKEPSADDGVKNGDESDVDCGGSSTGAPRCEVGRACKAHADCTTDGCAYDGKCALQRSCTQHMGGDTCGIGESNDPAANHESCCSTITFSRAGQTVNLDKYEITAGRMRAFVERTNGDLRTAMTGLAGYPQAWLSYLPRSQDEVNARLGPYEVFDEAPRSGTSRVDGCYIAGEGTRTWWSASPEDPTKMGKDQLDEKALNCVSFYMLYALCAWDGGRLPTTAEIQAAWRGPDNRAYPWGNTLEATRLVHKFNHFFPNTNGSGQSCAGGNCDNSTYIAAPGRRPTGYGAYGHADLAGLVYDMVYDGDYVGKWFSSGSFENHVPAANGQAQDVRARPRYWAAGGRCAR